MKAEWLAKTSRFSDGEATLHDLEQLMAQSPSNDRIRRTNEGARGAVLTYQLRYSEAATHLEQDAGNVFSMFRLASAYQHTGQLALAAQQAALITGFNQPTADEAFVVPAVREQMLAQSNTSRRH